MAGDLEETVRSFFAALDRMDLDSMLAELSDEPQAVDEISRSWMRGRSALQEYFGQMQGMLSNIRSQLNDVHGRVNGDAGSVTFWLEQDYELEGEPQHVSAPTTVVLKRDGGEWKVDLVHTIPLAEEE